MFYHNSSKNMGSTFENGKMKGVYQEVFPDYCKKAYEMGVRFAKSGNE